MLIKQTSVLIENQPGRLQEAATVLRDAEVKICAMSFVNTAGGGILRLIADRTEDAQRALIGARMTISAASVLGVAVSNRPGGLCGMLDILAKENLLVEYCYPFAGIIEESVRIVLQTSDNDRAARALSNAGLHLLSTGDLLL